MPAVDFTNTKHQRGRNFLAKCRECKECRNVEEVLAKIHGIKVK